MHAYEAIEQSLTFIEEHLTKEISTEELANTVGLSPFYFQRLFKRLVNKPVQEYVKLRRLAKVIENLKNTDQRILDVALDYGFLSHGNFTRAFKETYGITPESYRRDLPMLNTFARPEVFMNYVLVDEGFRWWREISSWKSREGHWKNRKFTLVWKRKSVSPNKCRLVKAQV